MIRLQVNIDADGAWPDVRDFVEGTWTRIARLPMGTSLGNSSIGILVELPDGRRVIAQQTLANLRSAMAAFEVAEQRDGPAAARPS